MEASKGQHSVITWHFSTPYVPWQNGAAECLVRTTKKCLATLQRPSVSFVEFQRVLTRIEAVINRRPVIEIDGKLVSAFELAYGRGLQTPTLTGKCDPEKLFKGPNRLLEEFKAAWKVQYVRGLERFDSN